MLWIIYILFIVDCIALSFVEDYQKNRFYHQTSIGAKLIMEDGTTFNIYSTETLIGSGNNADIKITKKNSPCSNFEKTQFILKLDRDAYYIINLAERSTMIIERSGNVFEVGTGEKVFVEDKDHISFMGETNVSMVLNLQGEWYDRCN